MKYESVKWQHYLPLYDLHIPPNIRILEIGLRQGGNHVRWKNKGCEVFAIEINKSCKAPEGVTVFYGDVMDNQFMSEVVKQIGWLDAVVDDGGHRPYQQYNAWKHFWPIIRKDGVFCVEDMHLAEKLRWRLWSLVDPRNMKKVVWDIWHEQSKYIDDNIEVLRFHEVHIYPQILFIKKTERSMISKKELVEVI